MATMQLGSTVALQLPCHWRGVWRLVLVAGLALAAVRVAPAAVDGVDDRQSFDECRKLVTAGKTEEAFGKYLGIPGGEFAAAALARGESAKFLELLRREPKWLESPRARLVEAELLLASGRKDEAKARFHTLATTAPKDDWGTGQPGYYPVELPSVPNDDEGGFSRYAAYQPAPPFSYGPGSHRDNWLLRRLIALDLTDDAAAEFARLWRIHQANSRPYLVAVPQPGGTPQSAVATAKSFHPPGFDSGGLQFALDYAFFLKRTNRAADALAVLLEPLRLMDMDRNPNRISFKPPPVGTPPDLPVRAMPVRFRGISGAGLVGVARKEFIRLAFGEFKIEDKTTELLTGLQQQIDRGENRARRVLAQVKLHQGLTDEALALELAYIENGAFDPVSATYRRGQIFDEHRKPAEAVTAFEQVLASAPGAKQLPDADELVSDSPDFGSQAYFPQPSGSHGDVRETLTRLYAALGRTDKVLEMQFSLFDANEGQLERLEQIEQMAARFKTAGQEARFNAWAAGKIDKLKSPYARANLAWQQGDYPAAIIHAAAIDSGTHRGWSMWQERFAKLSSDREMEFMRAVVRAYPNDAVARLKLLELEDHLDGPEAIAALEGLLTIDAYQAFPQGRPVTGRSSFKNYLDLAYRIMRLYEKNGQLDKLRGLGLRLTKGEKPFDQLSGHAYESYGENGGEEYGNACLALAVKYADTPAYQAELATVLKNSRWVGARSQLERRTGVIPAASAGKSPPWANLPNDVRVIVSNESVACTARNERYVYVGLPWGVAVYDFKGAPVTRILLGQAVSHLVAADNQVWAGTDEGLFCITADSWAIAHEPLGAVRALGLDGEQLWIGVSSISKGVSSIDHCLMTLNRKTLALRTFSAEEIGIERTLDFTRFESDGEYVWADNYFGLLRYDRAADTWSQSENPGPRENYPVHLIGIIDGQVWADVWLDDVMRHRPARLERKTLELTPLHLTGNLTREQRMINSEIIIHGHDHGQPVFAAEGGYGGRFVVEKGSNTIRRLREPGAEGAETISNPRLDGVLLPDGKNFRIPQNAWADGLRAGVRSTRWSERWPGDAVWAVVFDDARQQEWLCVGAGLAVMPRDGSALRHFGSTEGLNHGPVLDGVELAGKLYFGSAWDDHRGCLTVHDPQTGGFTPWFRSDGMDTDKVVGLAAKDGQIEVSYGVDYPGDDTINRRPPGRFDPATSKFTSGGTQEIPPVKGKLLAPASNGTLPLLGGPAYRSYERDGSTWHCGSRGLVIFSGKNAPMLTFAPMQVRRVPSPIQLLREEEAQLEIPKPIPAATLRELAVHPNRYVRVKALVAAYGPMSGVGGDAYLPILADCVGDSYLKVRATAVTLLSNYKGAAAIPPLRQALEDENPGIRAVAALALANHGEPPPLANFEEIAARCNTDGHFRLGWDLSIGVSVDIVKVYAALAPHADRKIFEFLLRRPSPNLYYMKELYPAFGASLRKHPDAAEVLLAVQDAERHGTLRGFVQGIFQQAGKELLPVLHEALASKDRVVRSNAARACGAIGELSSIPLLIQSLDMESGLARASIVWALGELKAREALPKLVELHQDARNVGHNHRAGSGFLAMQSIASSREQYTALRNLDAIASDWEEMKVSAQRRPHDPRNDEELLTPELILEAVRKIGPAAAQVFYRTLAASSNSADRAEAAIGLADGNAADREPNLKILRNLVDDSAEDLCLRARVSLLILGEPGVDAFLRDRLHAGDEQERRRILEQLRRLSGNQLDFFLKELEAIVKNPGEDDYLRQLARELVAKRSK